MKLLDNEIITIWYSCASS